MFCSFSFYASNQPSTRLSFGLPFGEIHRIQNLVKMKVLHSIFRLLSFKYTYQEFLALNKSHFIAGLVGTWIVGMGRYWDDPGAKLLQHLGLGSVIYIFVLAALIWIILLPFKLENWKYSIVATFIGLTSFPAIFYAIPVERYFSMQIANSINVWFLAIVALWRLALLFFFLKKFTKLSIANVITVTLMPICLIISVLTVLNLHRVVFNIMGGMRNATPHDASYGVLIFLTTISIVLILPLLLLYGFGIYKRRKSLKDNTSIV